MAHPRHGLDPAFQTPIRFSLMAALGPRIEIEFGALRDYLETDDSALSKAVSHFENLGYVKARKGYVGNRPRTWIESTSRGRNAFTDHVHAVYAIAGPDFRLSP